MKRFLQLVVVVLLCPNFSSAQDPEFTQFYANPLYLNPALAGAHGCPRINLNYRNQWPNLSGAFVTNSISFDDYINVLNGGVGVMITHDMAGKGTLNWTTVNLAYSYHLPLTKKWTILLGAQATYNQKYLDWKKLSFGDQIDPHRGFIYSTNDKATNLLRNGWTTKGFFDVSVGAVLYSDNFYAGYAAKHLNQPNESLKGGDNSLLSIRQTVHVGARIPFGKESQYVNPGSVSPNIIYTNQQGQDQLNIGMYFKYGALTAGAWYRFEDAFILSIGIETGPLSIGYSYDVTTSKLTMMSGGSHELSLGYRFACKERKPKYRTVSCPSY